jgi:prophage regulatory protein
MSDRPTGAAQDSESGQPDLLRLPEVVHRTGLARSTIYRLMACRRFRSPVRLADRAIGWRRTDLDVWRDSLPTATR